MSTSTSRPRALLRAVHGGASRALPDIAGTRIRDLIAPGCILVALAMVPVAPAATQSSDASPEPRQFVQQTTETLLSRMAEAPDRAVEHVEDIVLPAVDMRTVARHVLPDHWGSMTPAQRSRFIDEFESLLVRTYASTIEANADAEVLYGATRSAGEGDRAVVETRIGSPRGRPVAVDYRLSERKGQWKVVEITVDGVSLVRNYRGTLGHQIARRGIDGMIDALAERNARRAGP